ncbi:MAG TPA: hydroxyacylglutathione hydrolase family protein [Patescibacteria group bacterium]|nr:hydroxyacylglutathione hydrolase family protein [Patescibacteria group bacterium]
MLVKQFRTGGDRNFGYLAADEETGDALIVDPSFSPRMIADFAVERRFTVRLVFVTHDHYDHSNGNREIERSTGIRALSLGDTDPSSGTVVQDGARFDIGRLDVVIIHTPGHTADSICVHAGDALFTGDTLFVGKVGGTDFGEGARREYDSLHRKLMALPDETRVFPGHDYGLSPESTIGAERMRNPFILQPDFDAFVHLKRNWEAYKKEHGIP